MKLQLKDLMTEDTNLEFKRVSKLSMFKNKPLNDFFTQHAKESPYAFQIKKCFDPECWRIFWLIKIDLVLSR